MNKNYKTRINSAIYRYKRVIKKIAFPLSQNAENLRKLKNTHVDKRCFIIGNGPSLRIGDLDKLKDEITFAFNRIYLIFDKTEWRPTYYCSEDNKTIFKSNEEINQLNIENKFFPTNFPWDYNLHFKFSDKNSEPKFSEDIVKGIYWGNTVAYSAIQMAIYMGMKEIYLLGIDHSFSKVINGKGEIIIDETAKDYFTEMYNSDHDDLYIPNVELSTRSFLSARKYADTHNVKI
jgi:hypothetical protein